MVRGKVYYFEDKDVIYKKYNYEEDRYCFIKRSFMKFINFEMDDDLDRKFKEVFFQGLAEEIQFEFFMILVRQVTVNGVFFRFRSLEFLFLLDFLFDYCFVFENSSDKYFIMNLQKLLLEMAEIRVFVSLFQRGYKIKKFKIVIFLFVVMVIFFFFGFEEFIGDEEDRNLVNIIDFYQCLYDKDFFLEKFFILFLFNDIMEFVFIQGSNEVEIVEMQELWNILGIFFGFTTMDDGAYDNIDYLFAQNKVRYDYEV